MSFFDMKLLLLNVQILFYLMPLKIMWFLRSTVQNFSFVMVNADAVRSFGFCRSAPNADTALVSNILIVEESHKSIFISVLLVTLKFRQINSRSWYRVFRGTRRSTSCSTTRPSSLCLPTPANSNASSTLATMHKWAFLKEIFKLSS